MRTAKKVERDGRSGEAPPSAQPSRRHRPRSTEVNLPALQPALRPRGPAIRGFYHPYTHLCLVMELASGGSLRDYLHS